MSRKQPIDFFDADDLIMSATSYYLGRMTANVSDHCRRLVAAWPHLKPATQDYIERIVESAFKLDRRDYAVGVNSSYLGMDCDRDAWLTVRACWKGPSDAVQ